MPSFDGRFTVVAVSVTVLLAACTGGRQFQYRDGPVNLRPLATYYIVLNGSSEKVVYDYAKILQSGQSYDTYASGRKQDTTKPDVPSAIGEYLNKRGGHVLLGPEGGIPAGDVLVVRYRELWGWDMGDIIKSLSIAVASAGQSDGVAVSFEEMSIFNTHPTARNLVPQMMDRLFSRGPATAPVAAPHH